MATLRVLGDTIQVTSTLKTKEIEAVKNYNPALLTLKDAEGNDVFAIGLGTASATKYGVIFCSTNHEGYAFVTSVNSVEDHSNPEKEKELLIKEWAPIMSKLNVLEEDLQKAVTAITEMESALKDSMQFN